MFRFVPNLTDKMNVNDLRVAILNYIMSVKNKDKLHICINEKNQEIVEILGLFGIVFDEVTYQNTNIKFHQQLASKLLQDKNAFCCFCGAKDDDYDGSCEKLLDSEVIDNENPFVVRVKKDNNTNSFIIFDKDNFPTYNFACAIDDMLGDVSLVIKDQKDIQDEQKQKIIQKYLGYDKDINYIYLPTIKGDNIPSIKALLEDGYMPQAIANYVLFLGYESPKEVFTIKEAIEFYDIKKLSQNSILFEIKKLNELNREHIKQSGNENGIDPSDLYPYIKSYLGEIIK